MRKPKIPTEIRAHIDKVLEHSGQQFSSGDLQASLRTALQAWEISPNLRRNGTIILRACHLGLSSISPILAIRRVVSNGSKQWL